MTSFITNLRHKLKAPTHSKKERILWFVGLYAAALITMAVVMMLIHGIVALLIAI